MKKYLLKGILNKSILAVLAYLMLGLGNPVYSEENYIIITGQVINTKYGNPVYNHKVYVQSDLTSFTSMYYFNELLTDEEGFFYDTISAEVDYGSLDVFTYDYQGTLHKNTLHYRFYDITNNNTFLVNFAFYMPYTTPTLQAKFRFVKKVTGDKFRFKFVDNTENDEIRSWHWDFGDGQTSSEPDPEHIYSSYGMFKVSLTIEAIANGHPEISTISKYIHIPLISFYNMGGHCFSDMFPIDTGEAVLYSVDENNILSSFDTIQFDTLGYYWFYQVPEGKYCVKVQPSENSLFFESMVPTYYGNTSIWKEAEFVGLTAHNLELDVYLIESKGIESGNGSIEGSVALTNSDKAENDPASAGVPVYLLDAYDIPLACCYTDENGEFKFQSIAMGIYWVYPEVTGLDSDKLKITLNQSQSEVSDLEVMVHTDQAHLINPGDIAENDHFLGYPFPNPANNVLNIELFTKSSGDAQLDIIDMSGRIVVSESMDLVYGLNERKIKTDDLTRGIYIVRISTTEFSKQRRFIISR